MDLEAFATEYGIDTKGVPNCLSELGIDINKAIDWAEQGMGPANDSNPSRAQGSNNLEVFLNSRHEQTGEMRDLEEAILAARQAIEIMPNDHPDLTAYLDNLGRKLEIRYERTGEIRDLEDAIQVARQAIESTPEDYLDLARRLNNLGTKLGRRYERMGEIRDLEDAIQVARQAIKSTPEDYLDLACRLNNLGNMLSLRYKQTGETKDLEESIKVARQAIEAMPNDHPDLAACLHNLGAFLNSRYERMGEMRDLEDAIQVARQAVESTPEDHPALAGRLNHLGAFLNSRYERTGEMRDLEDAIPVARQAIKLTPKDHPDLAGRLHNLGNKLLSWYTRTGEVRYLEDAINIARQAIKSTPSDHPDLATYLDNLGNQLKSWYERTGKIRDLQEAIQVAGQAIESTPEDHPALAGRLHNLGNQLLSWYTRTGEVRYLEDAINIAIQAIESTPSDHPDLANYLNSLGNQLESWYERMEGIKDLEDAIQVARQAIELTPDNHPALAGRLNNLGNKLKRQYERTGEIKHLDEASAYLFKAWSCLNAVPFHRVNAAAQCLKLFVQQHKVDQGIDLGRKILDLLPSVYTRALDRNDQQFVVSTFAGVASDLCGLLLSTNRLTEALECLEQGRAIIIGQLLDDRSDLSLLRRDHSQLADRYQSLVDEVNAPIRQTTLGVVEALLLKRRQEAAGELDMCLKEIRCVPGHERFMLGQTVAEMQECITEGSIVVINITNFRSDAFIISSDSLRTIVLPELSASEARLWVSKDWSTRKKSEHRAKNDQFLKYLSWLWHACVNHIATEISASCAHPSQGLPRVWWIGSGLASSMPFHAAGIHTRGSKENAYCRMISSYTASIKALSYAQNQGKRAQEALVAQDTNTILIAAMPISPKGPGDKKAPKNLPGVEEEMREILNLTRSHMRTTVYKQPSADQVLDVLKTCRIAHFACHGISDILDPSNSGLIFQKSAGPDAALEQDRLTVQRVSGLRLRYAQIAYLSACSTAENKAARLSDEVIHVVSGFQVAGFPHVVGCLWPAGDSECVEVSKRFYSLILQRNQSIINNNEVASALQEAVMIVRADDLSMPLNWAQFVHYGI